MSDAMDFEDDDIEKDFNRAADYLQKNVAGIDQGTLLDFYGLYKQSTVGKCNIPKPGIFNLQGKAKWNAWNDLKDMPRNEAMRLYIDQITKENPKWDEQGKQQASGGQWVSVSRHQIGDVDADIPEADKSCFDYVKEGNTIQLVKLLNSNKTYLNMTDESGLALIHWAADRGNQDVLQLILTSNAEINIQDSDGQTALHYASSVGHMECVKLLIKFGAVRTIVDNDGQTCVDVAYSTTIAELLKS